MQSRTCNQLLHSLECYRHGHSLGFLANCAGLYSRRPGNIKLLEHGPFVVTSQQADQQHNQTSIAEQIPAMK